MELATKVIDGDIKPAVVKPSDTITDVSDTTPLPAERAPLSARIKYFLTLWTVKIIVRLVLVIFKLTPPVAKNKPDVCRTYTCRPSLSVRLFFPHSAGPLHPASHGQTPDPGHFKSKDESAQALLPPYLNIHGGGFAMGDASLDDHFCRSWCRRTGMMVASLNYSKSPLHPFPVAVHDVAMVARAVIDDQSLPIDKSRITIGGFSAGGNLALSATLLPVLQHEIQAVVAYYPIVDWSHPPPVKWAHRLFTDKKSESLSRAASFLDWGYVTAGQDRKEKLLSPCYASRDELPPNICLVGAQHDMLCREARDMIHSLADKKMSDTEWDQSFEAGPYKWMLIMGVKHGFTSDLGDKGARADRRRRICDNMYDSIHKWMCERGLTSHARGGPTRYES